MPIDDLNRKYHPDADEERVPLPPLPPFVDVVVSFDQALDNTGVVAYDGVSVGAWTIRSPKETTDLTGQSRTFARSVALQAKIIDVISSVGFDMRHTVVVYEAPATKGYRVEASLLGAHCVEWACYHIDAEDPDVERLTCARVSGQRAKTVVTGNPRADKAEVREALKRTYLPEQVGACTNDHERDALANLVTWLKDQT